MVYDDEPDWLVQLDLPVPTLKQMAARAHPPSQAVIAKVIEFLEPRARGLSRQELEPHWIAASLRRTGVAVTADEVAWVLLRWRRRRG